MRIKDLFTEYLLLCSRISKHEITIKIKQITQKLQDITLSYKDISNINAIDNYFTKALLDAEKLQKKSKIYQN